MKSMSLAFIPLGSLLRKFSDSSSCSIPVSRANRVTLPRYSNSKKWKEPVTVCVAPKKCARIPVPELVLRDLFVIIVTPIFYARLQACGTYRTLQTRSFRLPERFAPGVVSRETFVLGRAQNCLPPRNLLQKRHFVRL